MGTAVARGSSETHFHKRGEAFRIPGMQVNGMDVLEMRAAAEAAIDYVRGGNGPILMEVKTYRYRGHSMSDPAKYRSREEVQDMKEKSDPIDGLRKDMLAAGITEEELKVIDKDIRRIVTEAADFAETSPEPDVAELYTDILVGQY
jgi:pyruvate dehydrogenase E1 component alpha subunit